jgi:hypothetical protein
VKPSRKRLSKLWLRHDVYGDGLRTAWLVVRDPCAGKKSVYTVYRISLSTKAADESHCVHWWITPIYGGLTRPESYVVRLDNKVVGSGSTQRECKEVSEGLQRDRARERAV